MLFARDLGFKTQTQNITAEHVAITNDTMTVFINGVNDIPGIVPDVIGMGANDAIYLLEKLGLKTITNGFGRVYRQSPIAGMSFTKGDAVSLELGFDELQIMKKDSVSAGDSIQTPLLAIAKPVIILKPEKTVTAKPKVKQNPELRPKVSQSPAVKAKPSQAAIDKWKAKVAAQKAKPSQAAIDKWKAKVAAQKALEKKKQTTMKNTAQSKK
jgi:beta-lactam-binding protein with PASTA domain